MYVKLIQGNTPGNRKGDRVNKVAFNNKEEPHISSIHSPFSFKKAHCRITYLDSPNCWMARSALQGSSKVIWTLRLWFLTRLSACREIPELAASEMMATNWKGKKKKFIWRRSYGTMFIKVQIQLVLYAKFSLFGWCIWPSLHSWSDLSPWC